MEIEKRDSTSDDKNNVVPIMLRTETGEKRTETHDNECFPKSNGGVYETQTIITTQESVTEEIGHEFINEESF